MSQSPLEAAVAHDTAMARLSGKKRRIIIIGATFALVFALAPFVVWGWMIAREGVALKQSLIAVRAAAAEKDIAKLEASIAESEKRLARIDELFEYAMVLHSTPIVGAHIKGVDALLQSGMQSMNAASDLVIVAKRAFQALGGEDGGSFAPERISAEGKYRLLQALSRSETDLVAARANIALALQSMERIPDARLLPQLHSVRNQLREYDEQLLDILDHTIPYVSFLPAFTGFPEEKTYLFLLQNNSEVRGTGGFIGNYGIMKIKNGSVVSFMTDNIYNFDYPAAASLSVRPPEPFVRYFPGSLQKWFLRDSNWSADFREAASQAQWFYQKQGGKEHLDGVIAMTPDVMESLLRVVGPVRIDGIEFSADTFTKELQYHVEKGYVDQGIEESQRKQIVGKIGSAILGKINSLSGETLLELAKTFETKLNEKHILLYANDPQLQQQILSRYWGGAISQGREDFLMVVDSNMGSMKTDAVMDKDIRYSVVEQDDGSLVSRVELLYRNNGMFSWDTTRYRNYVRIYIPDGSEIVRWEGAMVRELSDEEGQLELSRAHGKMEVGAYFVVEPRAAHRFVIEYRLPSWIAERKKNGLYTLFVQKQSGVANQRFAGDFGFKSPIRDVSPRGFFNGKIGLTSAQFIADLRLDRKFEIRF